VKPTPYSSGVMFLHLQMTAKRCSWYKRRWGLLLSVYCLFLIYKWKSTLV